MSPLIPLWRCSAALLVVVLLGVATAVAQPVRHVSTQFSRDVNAYQWLALLRVDQPIGTWGLELDNRFASDAYLLPGDRISFRDENVLRWRATRPFGERFSGGARGSSGWYRPSRVFSQEVYATLRYAPNDMVWVEPAVGAAWDQRPSAATGDGDLPPIRMDAGPAYGLGFAMTPDAFDGYALAARGIGTWQVINPRRGRTLRLDASAQRVFEDVEVSVDVAAASLRRDTYRASSFLNRSLDRLAETVEATTSDTLRAAVQVTTPLAEHLSVIGRVDLEAQHREVRTRRAPTDALFFDTDFDRRALDVFVSLRYARQRLETDLTLERGARSENRGLANRDELPPERTGEPLRSLRQADYDRGFLSLRHRLRADVLPRLQVTTDATASILRHDTPDVNPDDRDEALVNGRLGVSWQPSRYLDADVDVFASSYHTVYLRAERSAENSRRRSLRLEPALTWTPSDLTTVTFATALRATYTVYDFTLPGRASRDQSARELRYGAEIEHTLRHGLRLLAEGAYSDLRLGRLLWDRFAEIPFDTLRTYSGHVQIQARPLRRLTAETGVRFFIRSDYERSLTVRYTSGADAALPARTATRPGRKWIVQLGPTCGLRWLLSNGAVLALDGWVNVQHLVYRLYGDLPDEAPRTSTGPRTVLPNLTLTMTWDV